MNSISQNSSVSIDPIPLLDVPCGNLAIRDQVLQMWTEAYDNGSFIGGPHIKQLEQDIANGCQAKHAIACASGSDALLLALMVGGIEPGDEVIVPAFTFFSTASAVWRLGATPVFADIDPVTFNMDPQCVRSLINNNTKAIIPVHLFGLAADMHQYQEIASQQDLWLIEDAAQSIGAKWGGQMVGSLGDMNCFSFYPSKNLGGFGDGGIMTTNDDDLARQLRICANHGMESTYYHTVVGINSRLDSLQAAGLIVKNRHLAQITETRRSNAQRYFELFAERGMDQVFTLPSEPEHAYHVWNQFTIRVPEGRRDAMKAGLAAQQIGSAVYYPTPLHRQPCFAPLGYCEGALPVTEQASLEVLSLPIFPGLTAAQQARVVDVLAQTWHQSQTAEPAAAPAKVMSPVRVAG